MQIGEMLVRAKAITPADLEEAIGWQVLYGGRLGTNLLELGLVDEKVLAEQLGKQYGCEYAWGEMQIPQSMVQAIPGMIARRHEIVPWKVEGRRLKVLCITPHENLAIFDEMGFRLGKQVKAVVAPEFRVHQLLRRYFDSVRQMRALDFGMKPKGKRAQEAEKKAEAAELEKAADLMSDEAFSQIYAQVLEGRSQQPPPSGAVPALDRNPPSIPPARPTMPPAVTPPDMPRVAASPVSIPPARPPAPHNAPPVMTAASGWGVVPTPPPKPVAPPPPPPPQPLEVRSFEVESPEEEPLLEGELLEGELLDGELFLEAIDETAEEAADTGLAAEQWAAALADLEKTISANEPPPPPPKDMSPLSFQEAVAQISKADGRDDVATTVLRYARSKAARAVLLSVQGDVALGWEAVGEDLSTDVARRIAFPLSVPSAFQLVRSSRSHYIGPLGKEAGNVRFLKLAGKKWPASAVLLPVLFRGKVVYILYVDNGHKQHVDADVGELLILSQNITRSMEQMVSQKQAARRAAHQ